MINLLEFFLLFIKVKSDRFTVKMIYKEKHTRTKEFRVGLVRCSKLGIWTTTTEITHR